MTLGLIHITNNVNLKINNGYFSYLGDNLNSCLYLQGGNTEINNGEFYSVNYGIQINNTYNTGTIQNNVIINNAKVKSKYTAVSIFNNDGSKVIINNGSYESEEALAVTVGADNQNIIINSGIFKGLLAGIAVENVENTKISGGNFVSTNPNTDENYGGIIILKENTDGKIQNLKDLIAEGYYIYDDDTITEKNMINDTSFLCLCTTSDVKIDKKRNNIKIVDNENGTIKTEKTYAISGEIVNIEVIPNEYYSLYNIEVKTESGKNIEVSNNKFQMPDENVEISVTFNSIIVEDHIPDVDSKNDNTTLPEGSELADTGIKDLRIILIIAFVATSFCIYKYKKIYKLK